MHKKQKDLSDTETPRSQPKSRYLKDLPVFTGGLGNWIPWKQQVLLVAGINAWTPVLNLLEAPTSGTNLIISNEIYWSLAQATNNSCVHHIVSQFQKAASNCGGDGWTAWKALCAHVETEDATEVIAEAFCKALEKLRYTGQFEISAYINWFNSLVRYMLEADTSYLSKHKIRRIFLKSLRHKSVDWFITAASVHDWSLK